MKHVIQNKTIHIYGPTISNKTGLAINLAKYIWGRFNIDAQLISADLKKVYSELSIGQSLPKHELIKGIKVHMVSTHTLDQAFTLNDYKSQVTNIITMLHSESKIPIIYGGNPLCHRSLIENWIMDNEKRDRGEKIYDSLVLVPKINIKSLHHKIEEHVHSNFTHGIYQEFRKLAKKYQDTPMAMNNLKVTHEYREFFDYALTHNLDPIQLNNNHLKQVEKLVIDDLKEQARKQIKDYVDFKDYKEYTSFESARKIVETFLL